MYREILNFWFEEISQSQWWVKDDELDKSIIERFAEIHRKATYCELFEWRHHPRGRLAEIIVLDQFSRNMFRGSPLSFENDSLALALSQEALAIGADKELDSNECGFLYMPFMHSESLIIHEIATTLFRENSTQANYEAEMKHKVIIERFGRYPHRNNILGRQSTEDEVEFLKQNDSAF